MDTHRDELLAAAMQGDQTALQQLLMENFSRLAESIRPRIPVPLRATVDVEDILQVTFIHVFRDLSDFREGDAAAFYGWLRSIADARLADAIRTATRQKRGGGRKRVEAGAASTSRSFLDLLELLSDDKRSPSRSAATHEAVGALQVALAGIPDDQREAIQLRHIENLTLEEVAERAGLLELRLPAEDCRVAVGSQLPHAALAPARRRRPNSAISVAWPIRTGAVIAGPASARAPPAPARR